MTEYQFQGFNLARDIVHHTAVEKGWWEAGHEGRSFGELLALVHSEVSEALEDYRNGHAPAAMYAVCQECGETRTPEDWPVAPFGWLCHGLALKPEGIPSELADIIIRVLDIAGYYDIDIEGAMLVKAKYNESRAHRHGGKKL